MRVITMGSLFDGIGGFPLAAIHNGVVPLWASEIEPFPIRVTQERLPGMLHFGDITKLRGDVLPPVDIICGGSPCQDHNCVFVGPDENGEAKHAHLRSTNSQGKVFRINVEGSEAKHSFHKDGTDCALYVFEAPIDLLSHITLYPAGWLEHSYVACCGTSVQPVLERLRQNPKLNMVYLCLDNDEAGEDACENMMEALENMDVDVERLRPQGKDWNDDLCTKRGKAKTPTA